jgi:hypothetical protein
LFQPDPTERVFDYVFVVAQTIDQGCSYAPHAAVHADRLRQLIGSSILELPPDTDAAVEVALMDSMYRQLCLPPAKVVEFRGNPSVKAKLRAKLVADEVFDLVGPGVPGRIPVVTNVGVVGNIIWELQQRGVTVQACDLDPNLVGRTIHGVEVQHGSRSAELIGTSDAAVITGMTLANDTIDELLAVTCSSGCKTLIFAQSGASFAQFFIERGASVVVAEPFPFYIFQGLSEVHVFRRT